MVLNNLKNLRRKTMKKLPLMCVIAICTIQVQAQTPLTNTFTYQGELKMNNALANGIFDFEFKVYNVATNGTVLETVLIQDVTVTNGVFTTPITLINDLFIGNKIWLSIGVRDGASTGAFDSLSPRQEVTSSPYAIHAQFVGANAVTSNEILDLTIQSQDLATGSITSTKLANNSVTNSKLFNNSVTTSKLDFNTVTSSRLANNSVTNSKIAANAVTNSKIENNAVDANKLAAFSVNRSEISGTEIMIYRRNAACLNGRSLDTSSTCTSLKCSDIPILYYQCGVTAICGIPNQSTCSNIAIGYLLSPQIGL
jgi:hypothetical protein